MSLSRDLLFGCLLAALLPPALIAVLLSCDYLRLPWFTAWGLHTCCLESLEFVFDHVHDFYQMYKCSTYGWFGVFGSGLIFLSLPRNRHDESWRGGMTLPSFLEKSGFTGVDCRFRGMLEGGSLFLVLSSSFSEWNWCREQSFMVQKASGDCLFWSRAVFYRAKASVIIKFGAALFNLIRARWMDKWVVHFECSHFCWRNVWVILGLCTFSHSPFMTSFFLLFCTVNQTVGFLL